MRIRHLWLNLALAILWCLLAEEFGIATFVIGFLLGTAVLRFTDRMERENGATPRKSIPARKVAALLRLAAFFLREMIVANLQVAWLILRPRLRLRPAIVRVPIALKHDLSITALANIVALTPGTLTVDVDEDRRSLLIHCLDAGDIDQTRRAIQHRFEQPIRELES